MIWKKSFLVKHLPHNFLWISNRLLHKLLYHVLQRSSLLGWNSAKYPSIFLKLNNLGSLLLSGDCMQTKSGASRSFCLASITLLLVCNEASRGHRSDFLIFAVLLPFFLSHIPRFFYWTTTLQEAINHKKDPNFFLTTHDHWYLSSITTKEQRHFPPIPLTQNQHMKSTKMKI